MLLSELLSRSGVTPDRVSGDADISGMIMDSRKARAGSLFAAMPSRNSDSHSFIPAAKAGGATAVLAHSDAGFEAAIRAGLAAILIRDEPNSSADFPVRAFSAEPSVGSLDELKGTDKNVRATTGSFLPDSEYRFNEAVWRLAKVAFGNPSASMKIIGVTGTNGKTTTAWLIRDMLVALGVKAGYLGTLGFQIPGEERELQNTTPFSIELNELLAEARDKGVEAMAIEVSSHALAERRVDGIEFDAAVFTNLTQDHLDFHGTMEAYEAAKLRLFTELPKQSSKEFTTVLNLDDPVAERWEDAWQQELRACPAFQEHVRHPVPNPKGFEHIIRSQVLFGRTRGEFRSRQVRVALDHIWMNVDAPKEHWYDVEASIGGDYNVDNLLAAMAGAYALYSFGPDDIQKGVKAVRPVPGRFESVPNEAGIGILVDYAHTPDAVEKLLDAVRPLTKGRMITVFGCGGDRDRNKRPKMAKAASERSDITVITSDNPRTEDPIAILRDVAAGIEGEVVWWKASERGEGILPSLAGSSLRGQDARATSRRAFAIIDRREAIAHAIQIAQPGDVVVIAGKGHENYQIIGRTKYPMDDREMARGALKVKT